jgi:hypothetical protein
MTAQGRDGAGSTPGSVADPAARMRSHRDARHWYAIGTLGCRNRDLSAEHREPIA